MAVGNGRIIYVGDNAGLEEYIGPDTEVTDLHGRMMLPGFFRAIPGQPVTSTRPHDA